MICIAVESGYLVCRRTGGLKVYGLLHECLTRVCHRIGGLKELLRLSRGTCTVCRRIGGLKV